MNQKINIFWFRRDLRLFDNVGLFYALKSALPVLPIFIFDTEILNKLENNNDARVSFIYSEIKKLKIELEKKGSSLKVLYGNPSVAFKKITSEYNVHEVFVNKDYEPYGIGRDVQLKSYMESKGIKINQYNDHVIFEPKTILKDDGKPYTVYTPYSKKWKKELELKEIQNFSSDKYFQNLFSTESFNLPEINDLGFVNFTFKIPPALVSDGIISDYSDFRDLPAENGTSRLGIHLRFGTISIRKLTQQAVKFSETFLNQLIWRNFYIDILWHFPYVLEKAFKPKYDFISWINSEVDFEKWCLGKTGYPMVDAGMRELNATGFMHNRVRMVVASFLSKHLLIDWRWGEAYFAEKLLDYELASNNGNWQWAAGCGCDAAPYFRVFSPEAQQKKFDPQFEYIKKWVPEFGSAEYPEKMIDHRFARERVLKAYKVALR